MKNLKKLLAVVVTVALMATFMVPAFAATSDQDIAKDLGMLKGGDLDLIQHIGQVSLTGLKQLLCTLDF